MTWDVLLQLAEMRCATTSCDVRAEPNLVVTYDVHAGGAFSGLGSATPIAHIFGNNERTDD